LWGIVLTMDFREQPLGKNVRFLLPSLKLKEPCPGGGTIEQSVHAFLVEHFGGYTAGSATVAGYWREEDGSQSYGEHREFTVALPNDHGLPDLKGFLALTARRLCESCLYVEVAGSAVLLYSAEDEDLEVDQCLAGSAIDEEPSSAL
jgi:hypothetical protein